MSLSRWDVKLHYRPERALEANRVRWAAGRSLRLQPPVESHLWRLGDADSFIVYEPRKTFPAR